MAGKGRPFVKGDPRAGRPKTPADVKAAKNLTKTELDRLINKYLNLDKVQMAAEMSKPTATMLELVIGGIVMKAAKDHDHIRFDFVLNRLLGKVREQIEHTVMRPTIIHRLSGEQVELGMQPIEELDDGQPD